MIDFLLRCIYGQTAYRFMSAFALRNRIFLWNIHDCILLTSLALPCPKVLDQTWVTDIYPTG